MTAGDEVCYVTTPLAVESITAGERTFPGISPPANAVLLDHLESAARWQLADAQSLVTVSGIYGVLPWRTAGHGQVSEVTDAAKGRCLRVELLPEGKVVDLQSEGLQLQPGEAIPIPGHPGTLGVWVKGILLGPDYVRDYRRYRQTVPRRVENG